MLTLDDFRISSFEKKCEVVTSQANYISMRVLGDSKVYLYNTGEFFIEVYYSPSYKQVLMIHAFNDMRSLEPYIDKVSLVDLGIWMQRGPNRSMAWPTAVMLSIITRAFPLWSRKRQRLFCWMNAKIFPNIAELK